VDKKRAPLLTEPKVRLDYLKGEGGVVSCFSPNRRDPMGPIHRSNGSVRGRNSEGH